MKKIIICTVSIGLVLVVGLTALIMALVPVGQNNFVVKPTNIYLYNTNTTDDDSKRVTLLTDNPFEDNTQAINAIYKVFNESFSQKALTALFKGELGDKVETHYENSAGATNYVARTGDSTKLTIVFDYSSNLQTIKVGDKEFEYKYLFFQINDSTERSEVIFGVNDKNIDSSFENKGTSNLSYKYWFTAKMDMTKLYDYFAENKFPVAGKMVQLVDSRS